MDIYIKYIISLRIPIKHNPDKTCTIGWTVFPIWTLNKRDLKENNNKNDLERKLGPRIYKYRSDIGLEPKYTIGKKLKKLKKFKISGPSSYNIKTDVFNGPKYFIGLKLNKEKIKNGKNKDKDKNSITLNIPRDVAKNKGFSFPKA